jgi:predicted transcriptional regulator
MSALVNPHNEDFLDEYNKKLDEGDADIEAGNYATQNEVEQFFAERRKDADDKFVNSWH